LLLGVDDLVGPWDFLIFPILSRPKGALTFALPLLPPPPLPYALVVPCVDFISLSLPTVPPSLHHLVILQSLPHLILLVVVVVGIANQDQSFLSYDQQRIDTLHFLHVECGEPPPDGRDLSPPVTTLSDLSRLDHSLPRPPSSNFQSSSLLLCHF